MRCVNLNKERSPREEALLNVVTFKPNGVTLLGDVEKRHVQIGSQPTILRDPSVKVLEKEVIELKKEVIELKKEGIENRKDIDHLKSSIAAIGN